MKPRYWTAWLLLPAFLPAVAESGRTLAEDQAPAAAWPSGPLDLVLTYPRPLDANSASRFVGRTIRETDPAGTPPRGAAAAQPYTLRITGSRLEDGGRTLVLATDPHSRIGRYTISTDRESGPNRVTYDLSGVEAVWTEPEGQGAGDDDDARHEVKTWWPSLCLESVQRLAAGSAPHARFLECLRKPGMITVSTLLSLPAGEHRIRVEASGDLSEIACGDEAPEPKAVPAGSGVERVEFPVKSRGEPFFFTLTMATGAAGRPPVLRGSWAEAGRASYRPLEETCLLPWAPLPIPTADAAVVPVAVPDLVGGNPQHGREIFLGKEGRCSQCHVFRGQGETVGPDLTDVGRKGWEFIYRSVAAPSEEIAPEFLSYTVATRDGRVFGGVVRSQGADSILVIDTDARTTTLRRADIEQVRPSATSIMPVGLLGVLGTERIRDLVAYLAEDPAPRAAPPPGR